MTPSATPPQTPRRIALTVLALLYIFGMAAYLAYSYVTDTGLSGWLMDWQLRHFSEAHTGLTQVGLIFVWGVGLVPLLYALARLNKADNFTPAFPGQQPPVGGQPALTYPQHQEKIYSLRTRAITAAVFVLLSGGVFLYLTQADDHLAAQPVVRLNLNQTDQLLPGTELASVHGLLAANFGFALEETKYGRVTGTTTYAPIVPKSWEPGQPVKFVVKTAIPVYQDLVARRNFFLDSGQVFTATYDGRLSTNDLPTYVSQHLASQHLTLANPYYVLDDNEVAMGHATLPDANRRWTVLGMGLVLAVIVLVRKQPGK